MIAQAARWALRGYHAERDTEDKENEESQGENDGDEMSAMMQL